MAKMVKKRRKGAKVYPEGGRAKLAEKELSEIKAIETFLLKALSADEVAAAIDSALAEVGYQPVTPSEAILSALSRFSHHSFIQRLIISGSNVLI